MAYIWYERVWHAYNTQFSHEYDTHLPHKPNPTHREAYTRQSPCLRLNTTSFQFYLAYYFYALSWDWVQVTPGGLNRWWKWESSCLFANKLPFVQHVNDPCIYARCLETELRLHLFLMKDGLVEYVTFGLCVWLQEIYVHILDLTETKKVWEFAESFKKKYKTLNVLVRLLLKWCIYKVWGQ